jgi:WD40 repeat protein
VKRAGNSDEHRVTTTEPLPLCVFLSYSRNDQTFLLRLAEALTEAGFAPDYDQSERDPTNTESGIAAEDEWWPRLQDMIGANDVMVFLVSPVSGKSRVCDWEINCARELGKRIIAVGVRPIDFATAPPLLAGLNVKIRFDAPTADAYDIALAALIMALRHDVGWYRESSRLTQLARRWLARERSPELLLGSTDVRAVGELFERRPPDSPAPFAALAELRNASRARLEADDRKQRRLLGRAFVKPAWAALREGNHEHSLRLAAAGATLAQDLGLYLVPELWEPAAKAIYMSRTRAVLSGHAREVRTAAISPDGQRVLTAWDDMTAHLWDAATGSKIGLLHAHVGRSLIGAFSPDGKRVVLASDDRTARLWDAETGAQIAVLQAHTSTLNAGAFSPDGKRVLTASDDGTARLWDAATGAEIAILQAHTGWVKAASFSPDGKRVLTASSDQTARLWDTATGAEITVLQAHTRGLNAASFSPDGKRVLTASNDQTARLWDAETGAEIAVLQAHTRGLNAASFSPDGKRVLTASDDQTARLWDTTTGAEIAVLKAHTGWLNGAWFSPNGKRVVTASDDQTARLWDAETGAEIAVLKAHTGAVNAASFSPDGKFVVTASDDQTVRLWDVTTTVEIAVLYAHDNSAISASFSADGTQVVTASSDQTARLWDTATGTEIDVLRGHDDGVTAASFSPDGKTVVTASSDCTARLWDAATGAEIAALKGHDHGVTSASFSPDGKTVVTGSFDETARVWNAATGDEITILKSDSGQWLDADIKIPSHVLAASFSPDGKCVATASDDGTVRLWDSVTGAEKAVLRGHDDGVTAVSFSPDGKRVLTASSDQTARMWDTATGAEIAVLQAHTRGLNAASFSPDGKRVLTASDDQTARLWDTTTGAEIAVLHAHEGIATGAAWHPDGRRIITAGNDGVTRIWDVSRTVALTANDRSVVLTAAFARGIGLRTAPEAADLLMQESALDHDGDLHAEALKQLGRPANDPELGAITAALHNTLHPNCYWSPSQYRQRFGLWPMGMAPEVNRAVSAFDNEATLAPASDCVSPTAEEMAGEAYVETHAGIGIFRLADGRFHIVASAAVGSLAEARALAEAMASV